MTALTLRASQALRNSPFSAVGRLFAAVSVLVEVFAEAQQQAAEAQLKFPFDV